MKTRIRMLDKVKFSEISLCDHPANENSSITSVETIPLIKRQETTLNMSRPFQPVYDAYSRTIRKFNFPVPGRDLSPYTTPSVNRQPELSAPSAAVEMPLSRDDAMKQMRSVMSLNGSGDWSKAAAIAAQGMRKTVISTRPGTVLPSGPSGNAKPLTYDVRGHHRTPDGGADSSFMEPVR